jgi:hypothetical protein
MGRNGPLLAGSHLARFAAGLRSMTRRPRSAGSAVGGLGSGCGKRLKALLPILLPALERNGHMKLDEGIRSKVLAMSASTIDRVLRTPRGAAGLKRRRPVVPEVRRRVPLRTFAGLSKK